MALELNKSHIGPENSNLANWNVDKLWTFGVYRMIRIHYYPRLSIVYEVLLQIHLMWIIGHIL